ncbi:MAG: alanine racemase [Candidatus Dormibacteria bacterium]
MELDRRALEANVADMVAELGHVRLMPVVKAQAYGHGAATVAGAALAAGAARLATATLDEALELRSLGVTCPVLVLGHVPGQRLMEAAHAGVAVTLFAEEHLPDLEQTGGGAPPLAVHVKVDSGMSRLGVNPQALPHLADRVQGHPGLLLEGVFTHFRKGEEESATLGQLERFLEAVRAAEGPGGRPWVRHAAASAAWRHLPESRLDAVRSGLEMLGLTTPDGRRRRPVLSWRAQVVQLREIEAGTYVSYGDTYQAPGPRRLAVLPVGYADGFRRGPRNWGSVLLGGRECPLAGAVTMDMTMVDVSEAGPVAVGDQATLIGRQDGMELSAEEVARRLGTINYEVTTQISPRVPRVELEAS